MRILIIIVAVIILSANALPQSNNSLTIKGKVVDKETGAPISDVNVFLSNTTFGASTGRDGKFSIINIPPGTYNIIFSFIGYETEKREVSSYNTRSFDFQIQLTKKAIDLKQVSVTGDVPEEWNENLITFKKLFLGSTENAEETRILNPEVIDLVKDKKTGMLKARSDSVVKVENKSLGYMIYIVLDSLKYNPDKNFQYSFYPRFKELTPVSEKQKQNWENNRGKTYLNSPKYFFYSLVHRQLDKNYFALQENNVTSQLMGKGTTIFENDLDVSCNSDSTIFSFDFSGGLKISRFLGSPSYLDFRYSSVSIDKYGNLLSSFYSVEISGAWASQGIADLLPLNYVYKGKP